MENDNLREWHNRIYQRPESPYWYRSYTFDGKRFRGCLNTTDRDEAARKVRDEWRTFQDQREQDELRAKAIARGIIKEGDEEERRIEMSLGEAIDRYMEEHGNKLPSRSVMESLHRTLKELMGEGVLLSRVKRPLLVKLRKELEKRVVHYVDGDRPLSERQINHHLKRVRAVMRKAMFDWNVNCSPHLIQWGGREGVMLPEPDYDRPIIEHEAQERAIAAALAEDTRALYRFALLTGLRGRNGFELRWSQVHWLQGIIKLPVKSHKRNRRTGESGKLLEVIIDDEVAEILRSQWGKHPEFVFTYEVRTGRTYVSKKTGERVARRSGERRPFTASLLRDRWNEARAALGLGKLTWHGLRATFATRLLDAGVQSFTVRDLLGHADVSTTEGYARVREHKKREAIELLRRSQSQSGHSNTPTGKKVVRFQPPT
jgi:integrase